MEPNNLPFAHSLSDLGMSEELIGMLPTNGPGLVFITGLTGSGKTTTASSYAHYLKENYGQSLKVVMNWVTMTGTMGHEHETETVKEAIAVGSDVLLIDEVYAPEVFELAVKASSDQLVIFTHHAGNLTEALKRYENYASLSSNPEEVTTLLENNLRLIICGEIHQVSQHGWHGDFKTFLPKPV